jgi:hypothetical protein
MSTETHFQIVISRFMENIDWCFQGKYKQFNKIIYNKGAELHLPEEIPLANVGRESHTFLYHIVENYHNLADVTVFLPGSCQDATKVFTTELVINKVLETKNTVLNGPYYENVAKNLADFRGPKVWQGSNTENRLFMPTSACAPAEIAPFGNWFKHYLGEEVAHVVCFTSIFAVSKEHILQKPLSHYKALLECVSIHSNPEEGHYFERSWQAVFGQIPATCLYYPQRTITPVIRPTTSSLGRSSGMALLAKYKSATSSDKKK